MSQKSLKCKIAIQSILRSARLTYIAAFSSFTISFCRDLVIANTLNSNDVSVCLNFLSKANLISAAFTGYISLIRLNVSVGKLLFCNLICVLVVFLKSESTTLITIFVFSSLLASLMHGNTVHAGLHWMPYIYSSFDALIVAVSIYVFKSEFNLIFTLSRILISVLSIVHFSKYKASGDDMMMKVQFSRVHFLFAAISAILLFEISYFTDRVFKHLTEKHQLLLFRCCVTGFTALSILRSIVAEKIGPLLDRSKLKRGFGFASCLIIPGIFLVSASTITWFSGLIVFGLAVIMVYGTATVAFVESSRR